MRKQTAGMMLAAAFIVSSMGCVSFAASASENQPVLISQAQGEEKLVSEENLDLQMRKTGLVMENGIPYVYDENGVLVRNATPVINGKKYYVNGEGIAQSGWLRLADWQMYFDPETYEASTGISHIDGKAYLFDENGVEILKSRTEVIDGKKYWFQPDGSLMSGWCVLGDWTMYYDPDTYVGAAGLTWIDGKPYVFDENGVLMKNATPNINGAKYYVNAEGIAQSGWLKLADWQMYFDPETYQAATGITHVDGKAYLFDENGVEILKSRTEVINGKKYWFQPDGTLMSGWCDLGDWRMYFDPDTYEAAVGIQYIYGSRYQFDENGVLIEMPWWCYSGNWACNDGKSPLLLQMELVEEENYIGARLSSQETELFLFEGGLNLIDQDVLTVPYTDPYGNSGQFRLQFKYGRIELYVNEENHVSGAELGWKVFNGSTFRSIPV